MIFRLQSKTKTLPMKHNITGQASITIDAPASAVWEALTNPKLIKQYFFETDARSDWNVGSPLTFEGEWDGKLYQDKGTILAKKINKLLRYSYWSSMSGIADKPENYVTVTYELLENAGKTMLTVTQENIPDKKMKEHAEENWTKVLANLKNMLENQLVNSN
jgi:uncharacterized protein YndB with AHSA1/START domain